MLGLMNKATPKRSLDDVALFQLLPELARSIPWVRLGDWPTAVEPMDALTAELGGAPVFVKREDQSSTVYGGNKVRTLESVMARARAANADRLWATGAYGSNHALAAVLHAPTAGLLGGIAVFPQPLTRAATTNLRAALSVSPRIYLMSSALSVPAAMTWLRHRPGRERSFVMAPGGASPEGGLGALSAALELAMQIEAGDCPAPARIVLAVGSACTAAGMVAGLHLAERLGVGFGPGRAPIPRISAVRVTPWPITSQTRIALMARHTIRLLAKLGIDAAKRITVRAMRASLDMEGGDLGGGYGKPTARGYRAIEVFRRAGGPPLDVVYTAKSAAAFLDIARRPSDGPILYWATKSSAPLPTATEAQIAAAPRALRKWLGRMPS